MRQVAYYLGAVGSRVQPRPGGTTSPCALTQCKAHPGRNDANDEMVAEIMPTARTESGRHG